MNLESAIRVLAGTMVLVSIVLFAVIGPWGLALAGFVGVNLIQSSFTGICPAEAIMKRLGIGAGSCSACSHTHEAASSES